MFPRAGIKACHNWRSQEKSKPSQILHIQNGLLYLEESGKSGDVFCHVDFIVKSYLKLDWKTHNE